MRKLIVVSLVLAGSAGWLAAQAPQMDVMNPNTGTIGTVVRANGKALGKDKIDSVYLSDHTLDLMVKVLSQSDDTIEFRIPPSVKPGKLQLVLKTTGKQQYILEQPFYFTVEEPKAAGEVAAASK
jgi:hypothetical protein